MLVMLLTNSWHYKKTKKNVKEESASKTVTNNSFFIGSTADLQKMLKQASKKKDK